MKWIYLLIAVAFEITWAVAMKMSNGFMVLIPSIVTGVGYIASAVFLAIALRQLPLGTAYAMWTGMGILGTTLLGVFLFMKNCRFRRSYVLFLLYWGRFYYRGDFYDKRKEESDGGIIEAIPR